MRRFKITWYEHFPEHANPLPGVEARLRATEPQIRDGHAELVSIDSVTVRPRPEGYNPSHADDWPEGTVLVLVGATLSDGAVHPGLIAKARREGRTPRELTEARYGK